MSNISVFNKKVIKSFKVPNVNCLPGEEFALLLNEADVIALKNDLKYCVRETIDGSFKGAFKNAYQAYDFANLLGAGYYGCFEVISYDQFLKSSNKVTAGLDFREDIYLLFQNQVSPYDEELTFECIAGFQHPMFIDKFVYQFQDDNTPEFAKVHVDYCGEMKLYTHDYNMWLFM